MPRVGGFTAADYKSIASYAELKGWIPGLSDYPNRVVYFRNQHGRTLKRSIKEMQAELEAAIERGSQA